MNVHVYAIPVYHRYHEMQSTLHVNYFKILMSHVVHNGYLSLQKFGSKRKCAACKIVIHKACFPVFEKVRIFLKKIISVFDCKGEDSYKLPLTCETPNFKDAQRRTKKKGDMKNTVYFFVSFRF